MYTALRRIDMVSEVELLPVELSIILQAELLHANVTYTTATVYVNDHTCSVTNL